MQTVNHFRALSILHAALVIGLLLFTGLSALLPLQDIRIDDDGTFENIFQAVAAVASIVCLVGGFSIFRRKLPAIRASNEPAEAKMVSYRGACIVWWAMLEGPGILGVVGYIRTGNHVFIALALFHLALLAVFMPRKNNIAFLLNLTTEEVQRLEGK